MSRRYLDFGIDQWGERKVAQAVEALEDVAADGADSVRETIHTSTTNWGRERVAGMHGPPRASAGRIETGAMLEGVDHTANAREIDEDVYEVRWGWEDPALYVAVQEHGAEKYDTNIVPMESLARSLDIAEEELRERLASIATRRN